MSPLAGPWTSPARNQQHVEEARRWDHETHRSVSDRISFPGERPYSKPRRFNFQRFIQKEWASVMFWVLSAVALAVAVDRVVAVTVVSDFLVPSVLRKHLAPGLIISNGLVLLSIQRWIGSCPNLICRICEFQMGRVGIKGVISAFVVHWIGAAALVTLLKQSLQEETLKSLLSLNDTPPPLCSCLCDFVKETIVSTLFPVVYFVAPTLLALNRFPVWVMLIFLYPLYVTSIDGDGRGSLLSPTVAYVACTMVQRGWWRIVAQCLGGFLGGRIMSSCFPDDPKS